MSQSDQVQSYFDALIEGYDALRALTEKAAERQSAFSKQLATELVTAQREALQLSKKLIADPSNTTVAYAAMLESAVSAQAHAVTVARIASEHAAGTGSDAQAGVEQFVAAVKKTAEAAGAPAQDWAKSMPFADAWKKGFEAFIPTSRS